MPACTQVVIAEQLKATAVVLVSAGKALAACAREAQPKRRLLPSAGKAGEPQ